MPKKSVRIFIYGNEQKYLKCKINHSKYYSILNKYFSQIQDLDKIKLYLVLEVDLQLFIQYGFKKFVDYKLDEIPNSELIPQVIIIRNKRILSRRILPPSETLDLAEFCLYS